MSLWGATVITSLASAIPVVGNYIVSWLWGGFRVDNPTLNRFYSFHYLFPFLLAALSLVHLAALHQYGRTNPLGINAQTDLIDFYPYFYVKDLVATLFLAAFAVFLVGFHPEVLGHPDNNIPANPYSTPAHIVPEWYFRAPLRYFFRWHIIVSSIIAFILLQDGMCYKTRPQYDSGNGVVLSGVESGLSKGDYYKNDPRVMNGMDKIMNLIYSHTVPPRTIALLLLTGIVGLEFLPGSEEYLYAVVLGNKLGDASIYRKAKLLINRLQGPNPFDSGRNGTMALPDGRKVQGKRSFVVGACRYATKTEGEKANSNKKNTFIIPSGCEKLLDLLHNHNETERRHKLIHYVADLNTLVLAYELIKSKPTNMTRGLNKETLDDISIEYFQHISKELLSGKFRFTAARRIYIPKPGKEEKRLPSFLRAIAYPREKVVQKAMELVLNIIYDPMFLPTSHGFRPQKSAHTALKMIDEKFKGAAWFIKADITKCFDTIEHTKLMYILEKEIKCTKTLALIKSGLKAGYVELGNAAQKAIIGTPQGSVLSPLLCNIFLHELDKFMEKVSNEKKEGVERRQNAEYTRINYNISKSRTLAEKLEQRKKLRRTQATNLKIDLMKPFCLLASLIDEKFTRVNYVRYADDFIICVVGSHELTTQIKNLVSIFLEEELGLQMNEAKISITKTGKEKAFFLGTHIRWRQAKEKKVVMTKKGKKSPITARMALLAPVEKLINKLVTRQFVKWNQNGTKLIAKRLTRMVNLDHADIIAYYNAVIRGILTYYNFADNRSSLGSIVRYIHMSCARTLALKYKLRHMSKAYKKFGTLLTCKETGVSLFKPSTLKRTRQFNLSQPVTLERLERSWANKLTGSNLGSLKKTKCNLWNNSSTNAPSTTDQRT